MKNMYDATGRYLGRVQYASLKAYSQAEERGFRFADPIEGVAPETTYFTDDGVKVREAMNIIASANTAKSGEAVTFDALEADTALFVDGEPWADKVDGTTVEVTFDDPGTYQLRFEKWPWLPAYFQLAVS